MANYLIHANPRLSKIQELRRKLDNNEIAPLKPFGKSLDKSMRNAKARPDGRWAWEERDYCNPPLAQERIALLDAHFDDLQIEAVEEGKGWERIHDLPSVWDGV